MASNEAANALISIDRTLKEILREIQQRGSAGGAAVDVADDRDLDGKYGDPQVKFLPRDWHGDDFKGCNFSTCPAELLDLLAAAYDYFARKNDESGATDSKGRPKSHWDRKSAALARGWAKRIRGGWKPPQMAADDNGDFDTPGFYEGAQPEITADDIPF